MSVRHLLPLLVVALLAGGCGSSGSAPSKAPGGGGGRILFVAYSPDGGSVVSVDPGGHGRRTVLKLPKRTAALSLDGPRLFYAVGTRLYSTNRQGGDRTLATSAFDSRQLMFYGFSFDRSGRTYAFSSGEGLVTHAYVGRIGGPPPRAVTRGPRPDVDPVLSPDGKRLAFIRYRRPLRATDTAASLPDAEVWLANSDGSGARRLLRGFVASYLQWSPDSTRLSVSCICSYYGITVLRADGGSPRSFATSHQTTQPYAWSPDGSRIAFLDSTANPVGAVNMGALGIFRPAGTGAVSAYSAQLGVASAGPAWSPDAKRIAYVGCDEDTQQCSLRVVTASGSADDQIADAGSMDEAQQTGFTLNPVVAWRR